ncbi:FtsK/SpoIIIE family DNA translocase [Niabella drilacis]|uniref:DNA segregation ATPase FtsK/SpoIIIE, S-DNA-T family n=1 Tax=Niabella drilacis (strain DSM 25811 / CCM 8410 / CCUG 62505 / LMG 26954 / E90) TaxID=1285928 RepID=A0A1G6L4R4_NIADE|nr:DNA translocase FtsK [Niabella drilacis]SDC38280.1 DNA segregation ATPase FtsK/SpoIIIE, S-DNA-T family [Niabella drilacis]
MATKSKPKNKKPIARNKNTTGTWKVEKEEKVQLKELAKDERTWKIAGTTFLLISFFLIISFISYFFTWRQDYTQISRGSEILWDPDVKILNLLGKLGALTAHYFIYRLFGVAAILVCTFFFVVGVNLLWRRRVFSVWRNLKYVTLGMLVVSAILSYLLPNEEFRWGGGVGNMIAGWLTGSLGMIGAGAVLALIVIAYFIWQFNPAFNFPKKLKRPLAGDTGSADEEAPAIAEDAVAEKKRVEVPEMNGAKLVIDTGAEKNKYDIKLINKEPVVQAKEEEAGYERITVLKPEARKPLPAETKETPVEGDAQELELPVASKPAKPVKPVSEDDLKLEINSGPIAPAPATAAATAPAEKGKAYEPTLDLKHYKKPSPDLLESHGSERVVQDPAELENNKNQIIKTLANYDIEIQKISATVGPTVTLYEIVPAAGVRISKIKNLEDDIALSLSALGIRIIAPIPGRGTIGIEVPNARKTIVSMKTLLASDKFSNSHFSLPIALGKRIDNENFIVDLATMPHLLMAGATGQGKSVGINAILVSLLYSKHPSQLKFVLVDPKKVELSVYSQIVNHFLARLPNEEDAIITDTKKVINTLNALCIEMDNRYDLLKDAGCRNIKEYNAKFTARKLNPEKGHQFLPFIVLVVDEFADLIMTAGKEVEMPIARLAQLARAIGIHLIIATQRPSVNIITGIIKANFPARIAFKVSSKIDSRTILDAGGADQLIGKGDMLISLNGEISRLQCAFVDTPEVDKVVDFIAYQEGYPQPFLLPEYIDEKDLESGDFDLDDRDSLFEDAARLIVANQIGSTSLLQRRMKLGYNRAGRLMDQLEQAGIVGPNQGSKAREVLIKTEMELQQHLDMLG